jgi:hypothetical protein
LTNKGLSDARKGGNDERKLTISAQTDAAAEKFELARSRTHPSNGKETAMIIQKADLFKGLSPEIVNGISKIMIEESYEPGTLIFEAGAPAEYFYVLVGGMVRLFIGKKSEISYTVNVEGEAFGWTGLVDRPVYTATAECGAPSKVMKEVTPSYG